MTDIVKRLRDPYERSAWGSTLYSEAADEIEMLRRIVATAATWTAAPGTTIAELRATLEPLRLGSSTADQPDGGPDEEDGPWAEGWAERSGTPDQQSARKGLDELTRMAQEDGLYDDPAQQSPCQHEWAKVRHTIYYRCDKCLGIATLAADKT
jgi:hypothetical protein